MISLPQGKKIHIVGIGGVGLSAIARVLLEKGYQISGSDRQTNALTKALEADGATIFIGHHADHVQQADALIVTSAVQPNHVEIVAAHALGIPVYDRRAILSWLLEGRRVIAVAGTHGKTTTTAMIAHTLTACGLNPGYIVGGTMKNTHTNASWGKGDWFVIEADEYGYMFHGLFPHVEVVTNVEWDHPDLFPTPIAFYTAFEQFRDQLQADGVLFACGDDRGAALLAETTTHAVTTPYGLNPDLPIHARDLHMTPEGTRFTASFPNLEPQIVMMPIPGNHNVQNALVTLAVAQYCGADLSRAIQALGQFEGTGRRFDLRFDQHGIALIDDYAHNPTKIQAALQASRARYPDREIWAIWQPHTYSRTQTLNHLYLQSFADADHVIVTDIYAAREQPIEGVSAAIFVEALQHPDARYAPSFDAALEMLDQVQPPAVILVMSAGDATQITDRYQAKKSTNI